MKSLCVNTITDDAVINWSSVNFENPTVSTSQWKLGNMVDRSVQIVDYQNINLENWDQNLSVRQKDSAKMNFGQVKPNLERCCF